MREPLSNIGLPCEKHAPKPDSELAKKPPESFIGKHVKIGFPFGDRTRLEHMWVKVFEVTEEGLKGTLNNDPLYADLRDGDLVEFTLDEIEEVL